MCKVPDGRHVIVAGTLAEGEPEGELREQALRSLPPLGKDEERLRLVDGDIILRVTSDTAAFVRHLNTHRSASQTEQTPSHDKSPLPRVATDLEADKSSSCVGGAAAENSPHPHPSANARLSPQPHTVRSPGSPCRSASKLESLQSQPAVSSSPPSDNSNSSGEVEPRELTELLMELAPGTPLIVEGSAQRRSCSAHELGYGSDVRAYVDIMCVTACRIEAGLS